MVSSPLRCSPFRLLSTQFTLPPDPFHPQLTNDITENMHLSDSGSTPSTPALITTFRTRFFTAGRRSRFSTLRCAWKVCSHRVYVRGVTGRSIKHRLQSLLNWRLHQVSREWDEQPSRFRRSLTGVSNNRRRTREEIPNTHPESSSSPSRSTRDRKRGGSR